MGGWPRHLPPGPGSARPGRDGAPKPQFASPGATFSFKICFGNKTEFDSTPRVRSSLARAKLSCHALAELDFRAVRKLQLPNIGARSLRSRLCNRSFVLFDMCKDEEKTFDCLGRHVLQYFFGTFSTTGAIFSCSFEFMCVVSVRSAMTLQAGICPHSLTLDGCYQVTFLF